MAKTLPSQRKNHIYFGYLLLIGLIATFLMTELSQARTQTQEVLIKVAPQLGVQNVREFASQAEELGGGWYRAHVAKGHQSLQTLAQNPFVEHVQGNPKVYLQHQIRFNDPVRGQAYIRQLEQNPQMGQLNSYRPDNPAVPKAPTNRTGTDPLIAQQWGMANSGATEAWKKSQGSEDMIVAVLDTGVDYTHEDLLPNLWRNPGEIPDNGIDDDKNGYVDDEVGWDFAGNDNKPYDLAVTNQMDVIRGGNPGHGTHCAGNVAARGGNAIGISGVAPNVKIMSLRFISEKGSGTTADAVKAIRYAVDNGAKILSNSWGGEGQDDTSEENLALKEAIQYALDKGTLFVAAAGNGRGGKGFNNDTDKTPVFPASYTFDNIITVAAMNSSDQLGGFSNFGEKGVHIGAPGVKVFATVPANGYTDVIIDRMGLKAFWDGTSMATPHVAGAAALYWSAHPSATYKDVKNAILKSAKKVPALSGKVSTGGKLDVKELMN
ncbi:MAG: S8 family peptidase [Bdellovibrionales bacterium]